MSDGNDDLATIDPRTMSPEEWTAFKNGAICRARLGRSQALAALIRHSASAFGVAAGWAGKAWTDYASWRLARSDFAALSALDDGALKDIGIARTEIESLVRKPNDPTRREHLKKAA